MADTPTIRIAAYIAERKVKIARDTDIPEGKLRRSLKRQERSLRAGELLAICKCLRINPWDFWEEGETP